MSSANSKQSTQPPRSAAAAGSTGSKAADAAKKDAKSAPKKVDAPSIDLSLIKVTPGEIKQVLDKVIADEKKSALSRFSNFLGLSTKAEKIVDSKKPWDQLRRFSQDLTYADQKQYLAADKVWALITLAMSAKIEPASPADKVYREIIGIKLDKLLKQSETLTKLRWWDEFFKISKDNFPAYCKQTRKITSRADVEEMYALSVDRRPIPLNIVGQVKEGVQSVARDAESAIDRLVAALPSLPSL